MSVLPVSNNEFTSLVNKATPDTLENRIKSIDATQIEEQAKNMTGEIMKLLNFNEATELGSKIFGAIFPIARDRITEAFSKGEKSVELIVFTGRNSGIHEHITDKSVKLHLVNAKWNIKGFDVGAPSPETLAITLSVNPQSDKALSFDIK